MNPTNRWTNPTVSLSFSFKKKTQLLLQWRVKVNDEEFCKSEKKNWIRVKFFSFIYLNPVEAQLQWGSSGAAVGQQWVDFLTCWFWSSVWVGGAVGGCGSWSSACWLDGELYYWQWIIFWLCPLWSCWDKRLWLCRCSLTDDVDTAPLWLAHTDNKKKLYLKGTENRFHMGLKSASPVSQTCDDSVGPNLPLEVSSVIAVEPVFLLYQTHQLSSDATTSCGLTSHFLDVTSFTGLLVLHEEHDPQLFHCVWFVVWWSSYKLSDNLNFL